MNGVYEIQKKAVDLAISLNPTTVTVSRVEFVEKDGGREEKKSNVGQFTICLYSRASRSKAQVNDVAGLKDQIAWTALADKDSKFSWGPNVTDKFTVEPFGTFRVVSGTPVSAEGQIAGYVLHIEVEK